MKFFQGIVDTDLMTKFGDQIVPMSRFRQEALGDSDGIAIVLREGRFMILEIPAPSSEEQERRDRLRRPTALIDGLDSRISRHIVRLGISQAEGGQTSLVITGRVSWNGIVLEYRDEMSETCLPLTF